MEWPNAVNVLDYGCGPGRRAFSHIFPRVEKFDGQMYSVDISKEMVEYAKLPCPHKRIHYTEGEIMGDFLFMDVKFDNTLSFYALHFIRDIKSAFKGFHKILKDGGNLGFMTLTAKSISTVALKKISQLDKWRSYKNGYKQFMVNWSEYPENGKNNEENKLQHFQKLLNKCGSHVKHLDVQERKYSDAEIDLFLEICLVVNPFLDRVPESMYPESKEEYRKVVTAFVGAPNDTKRITITHEHAFAVVQKLENPEK